MRSLGHNDAVVDAALRHTLDESGFVVVHNGVDEGLITTALRHLKDLRRRLHLPVDAPIVAPLPGDSIADALVRDACLRGLAADALGGAVSCFGLTYLCKPARSGRAASWHQDGEPWTARLNGAPAVTVWVALTDADDENGCLRVVPRSHGLSAQPLQADERPSLFGVTMDTTLVDEAHAISLVVSAGDVVVLHPNVIHGSGANGSSRPRIAASLRYHLAPLPPPATARAGHVASKSIDVSRSLGPK